MKYNNNNIIILIISADHSDDNNTLLLFIINKYSRVQTRRLTVLYVKLTYIIAIYCMYPLSCV